MNFERCSSEELMYELQKAKKQIALLEQDLDQYKAKKNTVLAKSRVGEGSEFIIELPIRLIDETNTIANKVTAAYQLNIEKMNIEFSDIYK